MMNTTHAADVTPDAQFREALDQFVNRASDPDTRALREVARAYFTNPGFRKALEDHVWQQTSQAPTCPGCSGAGQPSAAAGVFTCGSCGGRFSVEPVSVDVARSIVGIDRPMQANADELVYFDLVVEDRGRMHGFADRRTGAVVQWG